MVSKPFYLLFTLSCVLVVANGYTQSKNESFYVFRSDWSAAPSLDSCTYFMHEIKKSDTEYICRFYAKLGPMIRQEEYKDENLTNPNGRFCWYNAKGKIDSCGLVKNTHKDGEWDYYLGDSIKPTYYDKYEDGKYLFRHNFADTTAKVTTDSSGKVFTSIQIEAKFQGGSKGWVKYLERNLHTPDRFTSIFPSGTYTATVCFLVDKQGNTSDIYLRKSIEWSADKEVFDIIEKSPAWTPAMQNGKVVYYRQVQNISFAIN